MSENQKPEEFARSDQGEQDVTVDNSELPKSSRFGRAMEILAHLGLGELSIRIGTNVLVILLIVIAVWLLQTFYGQAQASTGSGALAAAPSPTPTLSASSNLEQVISFLDGISPQVSLHTSIPSRPRIDIAKYTVQSGDTLFGIGQKFNLNPKTLLWGNFAILKDDPHNLRIGQELVILPVDGTYYEWQGTETLTGVAKYFGVDPEIIVNFPGNHLDLDMIGDYAKPNIEVGTWLIVPGGTREFTAWNAPIGVTRDQPALARVMGTGSCGSISGGYIGYGTFIWPTNSHSLSGFDYSPDTNHRGIDLDGNTGEPVYAVDAGVVVYAGWNDYGYGNLIMIDHGNGWQSLYAHLNSFNAACGQSVGQGDIIGAVGSTGNSTGSHLHFELMNTVYGKVNPWNFLQ